MQVLYGRVVGTEPAAQSHGYTGLLNVTMQWLELLGKRATRAQN
jgi:hypothetical protein